MAKDDLKLKDLFTHLVNWIKGKFSEQDTKIAANKYTLPQATSTSLGGVKLMENDGNERDKGVAVGVSAMNVALEGIQLAFQRDIGNKQDRIKIVTTEPTASSTASDPEGTIYFKV